MPHKKLPKIKSESDEHRHAAMMRLGHRMHIEWGIKALFLCGIVSVLVSLRPDADAVNVNKFAQTSWPLAFIQRGSSTLHRASGTKAAVPEAKVLKNVNASEAGGPIRSDGRNNGRRTRKVCCPLPDDTTSGKNIGILTYQKSTK